MRLTGMDWSERGTATAMSLGGRAGKIARTIPHNELAMRDGLFRLLQRLDAYLGQELQDTMRQYVREFRRYRRSRGVNMQEYISEFERLYSEASAHGMILNLVTLSMELIDHAQLSTNEEAWVMQTVGGDYWRYQDIRRAMKRLPNVDGQPQHLKPAYPAALQTPADLDTSSVKPLNLLLLSVCSNIARASSSSTHFFGAKTFTGGIGQLVVAHSPSSS